MKSKNKLICEQCTRGAIYIKLIDCNKKTDLQSLGLQLSDHRCADHTDLRSGGNILLCGLQVDGTDDMFLCRRNLLIFFFVDNTAIYLRNFFLSFYIFKTNNLQGIANITRFNHNSGIEWLRSKKNLVWAYIVF